MEEYHINVQKVHTLSIVDYYHERWNLHQSYRV